MKELCDNSIMEKPLRKLPILKGLTEQHASRLIKDFTIHSAAKGQTIFYQSDESTDLYLIIEGKVKASLVNLEGDELILATFSKGDFFGELSLFDGRPRSATITASEDSTFGVLTRERFLRAVKDDPMIAVDIISNLVKRIRMSDEKIESLVFLDVSQRLVKFFTESARDERDADGCLRVKKFTHRDLAAHTGSSREAVSKAIKVLTFKGIVREKEGHFLVSPDMDVL